MAPQPILGHGFDAAVGDVPRFVGDYAAMRFKDHLHVSLEATLRPLESTMWHHD